jgi:uncharacterized protein (TIGR02996 family)
MEMETMTDDELALLRTICEQPDCDVPRLVYADWLEERGIFWHVRLIHEQIERQNEEWEPWDALSADDWRQCQKHLLFVLDPLGLRIKRVKVRRGFISEIRCTLAEFMGSAFGTCAGCEGLGTERYCDAAGDMDDRECLTCKGTRQSRNSGLARTLFGTHPITRVVLTDQSFQRFTPYGDHGFLIDHHSLYLLYVDDMDKLRQINGVYSTQEEAASRQSLLAVNYARSLHKLDPLTKEQV